MEIILLVPFMSKWNIGGVAEGEGPVIFSSKIGGGGPLIQEGIVWEEDTVCWLDPWFYLFGNSIT